MAVVVEGGGGGGGGGGGALGLGEPAAGALVAMRDEGGVVSEELGALVAARAELRAWPAAAERAALYRAAARVVFPMAAEGGGEWELLEALACRAQVAPPPPSLPY